jgi:hypothetical protein
MKMDIHLRRVPSSAPATALLLLTQEAAAVLDLCARLGREPLPRIFRVSGGFILKLAKPTGARFPGAVPLCARCDNLLLPVDAQLVPQLHEDEARALVRERGLVLLPGGRALSFDFDDPLPLSAFVAGFPLLRPSWGSLPTPRPRVDRIRDIRLKKDRSPDDILDLETALGSDPDSQEEGDWGTAEDIDFGEHEGASAEDSTAEPAPSLTQRAKEALQRLGQKARNLFRRKPAKRRAAPKPRLPLRKRLASWGKGLLALPGHISQSLRDRQRAALLRLLREFREGDPDKALRRALPVAEGSALPATNAILPFHKLLYSLRSLFRERPGAVWVGGPDVWPDLISEYHRAAQQATQRGDYRRAAFIYGKLLSDFRMAANVLMQGGLYHDAGVLYLLKVEDPVAAARAFEAAGELDRAVTLYRQAGERVQAGDALKRAGLEEAALEEYRQAAEQLVANSKDFLAAGEVMATHALQMELALPYFAEGWARRPAANDIACALRLASHFAERQSLADLTSLVGEADAHLSTPGRDAEAGTFYNEIARLADRNGLEAIRDDLRDRALLGLAGKLRQRADREQRQGRLVSDLLGQFGNWKPAMVSDAAYAVQAALQPPHPKGRQPRNHDAPITTLQVGLGHSTVTAACSAPLKGNVFIGFESGHIACFAPASNQIVYLPVRPRPVTCLATDTIGWSVVALRGGAGMAPLITSYGRGQQGPFSVHEERSVDGPGPFWIATLCEGPYYPVLALSDGKEIKLLQGLRLLPYESLGPMGDGNSVGALLLPACGEPPRKPRVLLFEAWRLRYFHPAGIQSILLNWKPGIPRGSRIGSAILSWAMPSMEYLEVAAVGEDGTLYWSNIQLNEEKLDILATGFSATGESYLAATLLGPGFAAGAARGHIDWFRCRGNGLQVVARTNFTLPPPTACFASRASPQELLIVCADGLLARVPIPN